MIDEERGRGVGKILFPLCAFSYPWVFGGGALAVLVSCRWVRDAG